MSTPNRNHLSDDISAAAAALDNTATELRKKALADFKSSRIDEDDLAILDDLAGDARLMARLLDARAYALVHAGLSKAIVRLTAAKNELEKVITKIKKVSNVLKIGSRVAAVVAAIATMIIGATPLSVAAVATAFSALVRTIAGPSPNTSG